MRSHSLRFTCLPIADPLQGSIRLIALVLPLGILRELARRNIEISVIWLGGVPRPLPTTCGKGRGDPGAAAIRGFLTGSKIGQMQAEQFFRAGNLVG
jgi:hypothetical protein